MAVLITGGTGKTGLHLARILQAASIPFLIASRRGPSTAPKGMPAVQFDWLDEKTYSNPFSHTFPNGEKIKSIYVVAPDGVADPVTPMNAFIDYAHKKHGVKRFTLLTGSSLEKGGMHVGKVWSHLEDDLKAEWSVLLATWFMENFSQNPAQAAMIRTSSQLITATGTGKIPFVSAYDIANVAKHTLTDAKPHNAAYRIIGDQLLTYDDVAETLGNALERKITHVKVSQEEKAKIYVDLGAPKELAGFLAFLESQAAGGSEDSLNDVVEKVTGKKPVRFEEFVRENKALWV